MIVSVDTWCCLLVMKRLYVFIVTDLLFALEIYVIDEKRLNIDKSSVGCRGANFKTIIVCQ